MNSKNLRTIMFIIIGVLILGVFLKILPYIIVGGAAIYLITKGYNYIKLKLNKSNKNIKTKNYTYSIKENDNEFFNDELDTSNAIDVDYKDVK